MELILGTAQLRRAYGVVRRRDDHLDEQGAVALLLHAATIGIDALDTAPVYGDAEQTIGSAAVSLPVHTKIDPALSPAQSVARSLQRLRRDRIDVLYVHDAAEVLRPDSRVLAEAHELVGTVVGCLGASVYELDEFHAAVNDARIELIQVPLNLLDRRFSGEVLRSAAARGCRVVARSALLQGLLANPSTDTTVAAALRPQLEEVRSIAQRSGRSSLQLAIGWVAHQEFLHGVIVGADGASDLDGVLHAVHSDPLEESTLTELDEMSLPLRELTDPRRWSTP